jgi:dTDP-4-amino-4,6-dideoxygalactose transaminase
MGFAQILRIEDIFKEKKRIYERYKNNLKNINGIQIPFVREWVTRYIMWVFNICVDPNVFSRDKLVMSLKNKNIETRNAFVPVNKQKVLIEKYKLFEENSCPNANYIMDNGFYLPSGNNISNSDIDFVCEEVIKNFKNIK